MKGGRKIEREKEEGHRGGEKKNRKTERQRDKEERRIKIMDSTIIVTNISDK